MSTHNILFYEEISKIISLLSSNIISVRHFICSSEKQTKNFFNIRHLLSNLTLMCFQRSFSKNQTYRIYSIKQSHFQFLEMANTLFSRHLPEANHLVLA